METLKKHMSSRHGAGESQPGSPNPENGEEATDGLVYKCHLCEASFGERGGALGHLAATHGSEYEQLVSKGALDAASDRSESADDDERGKFPDHANRKVRITFKITNTFSYGCSFLTVVFAVVSTHQSALGVLVLLMCNPLGRPVPQQWGH
jgi:hypothetical protein